MYPESSIMKLTQTDRRCSWCVMLTFSVYVITATAENITGFDIAVGGTNFVKVFSGRQTHAELVYQTGADVHLTAQLDTGTVLPLDGTVINQELRAITFPIHSKDIVDGFGTYLLTFTLSPKVGSPVTKEIVLFHEEPINGFSIKSAKYLPLFEDVVFDAHFDSGSNLETEWFLDTNDTCLLRHIGSPRDLRLNFTLSVPGTHNVTVIAANTVSRTFDSRLVTAIYRINGIHVEVDQKFSHGKTVILRLRLDEDANLPMGTLMVRCNYGDDTEQTDVTLNNKFVTMKKRGFVLYHNYKTFGNFSIKLIITSQVDNKQFDLNYEARASTNTQGENLIGLRMKDDEDKQLKIKKGETKYIDLIYTAETPVELRAEVHPGRVLSTGGVVIDQTAKSIRFPFSAEQLDSGFGRYILSLSLHAGTVLSQPIEVLIIHEEPVSGLKISPNLKVVTVGEEHTLKAVVQSGSNVQWEWHVHPGDKRVYKGEASEIIPTLRFDFPHPGLYNLTVVARNALSEEQSSISVKAIDEKSPTSCNNGGADLEIREGESSLVELHNGSSRTLHLVYCNINDFKITATLNSGTDLPTELARVDKDKKTIDFPVFSKDFSKDGFGTFMLIIKLVSSSGQRAEKEVVVFHEEPIKKFQVRHKTGYVAPNDITTFDVSLESGSNFETEWFLDTMETYLLRHDGHPRHLQRNFTLTVPGTHNVTVIAANSVSRTVDFLRVRVVRKLHSFTMEMVQDEHVSSHPVYFRLKTTETDLGHFGELVLKLDYGDSTEDNLLMCDEKTPCSGCFEIQHVYKQTGNYLVKGQLSNEVSSKTFIMHVVVEDVDNEEDSKDDSVEDEGDEDDVNVLLVITISCVLVLGVLSFVAFVLGGRNKISERCRARLNNRNKYKKFENEPAEEKCPGRI